MALVTAWRSAAEVAVVLYNMSAQTSQHVCMLTPGCLLQVNPLEHKELLRSVVAEVKRELDIER